MLGARIPASRPQQVFVNCELVFIVLWFVREIVARVMVERLLVLAAGLLFLPGHFAGYSALTTAQNHHASSAIENNCFKIRIARASQNALWLNEMNGIRPTSHDVGWENRVESDGEASRRRQRGVSSQELCKQVIHLKGLEDPWGNKRRISGERGIFQL